MEAGGYGRFPDARSGVSAAQVGRSEAGIFFRSVGLLDGHSGAAHEILAGRKGAGAEAYGYRGAERRRSGLQRSCAGGDSVRKDAEADHAAGAHEQRAGGRDSFRTAGADEGAAGSGEQRPGEEITTPISIRARITSHFVS